MITTDKSLNLTMEYPLEAFGPLGKLLFFDIETTGLSGERSSLYLIGCVYYEGGVWKLRQWFADRADAEEELLISFFTFTERFSTLIHFNGDSFDIPYLLKRCQACGLPLDLGNLNSFDIYKKIRPCKNLLGLDSLRQKSVERFLGVCREDRFSGGQLIEVYKEYLETRSSSLCALLLLHNEDDLKGMPRILPILFYPDFLGGSFTYVRQELSELTDALGNREQILRLTYESPVQVPVPVQTDSSLYSLELSGRRLHLSVPLLDGELKYFYADYQNYYYLIYEDQAVHKSVGQYVEKTAKKKATAKTCYSRSAGVFLPQPSPLWEPAFRAAYRDKTVYLPYQPGVLTEDRAEQYLRAVIDLYFLRGGGKH